jgi:O-acetyl-ADP-ribose deacetylase (regulator of RNase III)
MIERTADYKINNTTFRVAYGDITQLTADALVSSDDNYLSMGGGVSASLLRRGGEVIQIEARKHVPLKIGDVAVTSAGELPAKYIFHAVTIDYTNMIYASEESVHAATLKCMQLADTLGVKLIAFPALGTGVANFPFQLAAEVMTHTIANYLTSDTRIELVTLTLFARERVRNSDLNLFYERAVGLASISIQSKRLNTLLADVERIVGRMNMPSLSKRVAELQVELKHAQGILVDEPENLEPLREISKQVISLSSDTQAPTIWSDNQLEAEVLRTKKDGLLTRLNIQTSHLNRFQIEKAKYGGQLVPPRLEIAIEDMNQEISETQSQLDEVRGKLVAFGSN